MRFFRLKWFLIALTIAVVIAGSIFAFLPRVTVHGQGTLSVTVGTNEIPQFDVVSISDIPAYGVIETSGCGEFKGRVKLRFDMFMEEDAPYYDKCYVEVVDETSPEYLAGYPGKVDEKTGEPLDPDDYDKWLESLPTMWQNNPFHSHFVYFDTTVTDEVIKLKLAEVTEYFYAFHLYCWGNDYTFLSQWVKVPVQSGTIREVLIAGDSSPPNEEACETKATDITDRASEFDTRALTTEEGESPDLNIGEKGTIDVGDAATDRASFASVSYTWMGSVGNPANADGTIDTVEIWVVAVTQTGTGVGTLYNTSGSNYKCRDSEALGDVTAGSAQEYTGLSMDVVTGDFIGFHATGGLGTEYDSSGGSGTYRSNLTGDYCDVDDETAYTLQSDDALSLYGTGTEAGGFDISNTPASENLGTLEVNTTYYAKGTAPNNPVVDGDCTFTVTNNGDVCDLDMKISDFTGGVGWNIVASSPGADEVTVTAYYSGQNPASGLVLANTDAEFYDGLASSGTIMWDFSLLTGSSFSDGVEKQSTLTVTAVAED